MDVLVKVNKLCSNNESILLKISKEKNEYDFIKIFVDFIKINSKQYPNSEEVC